ncbi:hypothetical protein OKA04_08115 [Luteolibacter flavescens]|uniref:Uncharacterized protein n=1 Tax=Luteolibacter flavescens TaxID=1859460 RepID=A0ABT3FN57_9BACT|nr:hypothetical protein [Luteolibacter flavescens]MCW1884691.1 hypothetical protein [Luteolibacter flavescens]
MKRLIIVALAASLIGGGLAMRHCGGPAGPQENGSAKAPQSQEGGPALPTKSEDRKESKSGIREETGAGRAKIKFDIDAIRPDGLRGPDDGLVTVSYEFCVPRDEASLAEVRRISPGVAIHPGSRGRIGCGEDQALCIGATSGPEWKQELLALADLGYVVEIRECFFE